MGDVAAGVKNFKKGIKEDDDDETAPRSLSENSSDPGGHHRATLDRQGRSGQEMSRTQSALE
jgi:Sec-independent protein translocase protein TatA